MKIDDTINITVLGPDGQPIDFGPGDGIFAQFRDYAAKKLTETGERAARGAGKIAGVVDSLAYDGREAVRQNVAKPLAQGWQNAADATMDAAGKEAGRWSDAASSQPVSRLAGAAASAFGSAIPKSKDDLADLGDRARGRMSAANDAGAAGLSAIDRAVRGMVEPDSAPSKKSPTPSGSPEPIMKTPRSIESGSDAEAPIAASIEADSDVTMSYEDDAGGWKFLVNGDNYHAINPDTGAVLAVRPGTDAYVAIKAKLDAGKLKPIGPIEDGTKAPADAAKMLAKRG